VRLAGTFVNTTILEFDAMGYKVLGRFEDVMRGYEPRQGLEGPFNFSGRVLYYSPKDGQYWDPKTDFFVADDEMTIIHNRLIDVIRA